MTNVILSNQFEELRDFLNTLPRIFETSGTLLYSGRNCLRLFKVGNHDIVAKKFGNNTLKRLLSLFKTSKAKKSYRNGCALCQLGINTPRPIGYIEITSRWGYIKEAYYISDVLDLPPIADCYNDEVDFDNKIIADFACFVARLHQSGILHRDLNSTNVRYKPTDNGDTEFHLIDINRMSFNPDETPLSPTACFKNITRFSCDSAMFSFFVDKYLEARGWDKQYKNLALALKKAHDKKVDRKKMIKRLI